MLNSVLAGSFQSLIGILMNCNMYPSFAPNYSVYVSIPNRDFDELQFGIGKLVVPFPSVSIPNRDFDELQ